MGFLDGACGLVLPSIPNYEPSGGLFVSALGGDYDYLSNPLSGPAVHPTLDTASLEKRARAVANVVLEPRTGRLTAIPGSRILIIRKRLIDDRTSWCPGVTVTVNSDLWGVEKLAGASCLWARVLASAWTLDEGTRLPNLPDGAVAFRRIVGWRCVADKLQGRPADGRTRPVKIDCRRPGAEVELEGYVPAR